MVAPKPSATGTVGKTPLLHVLVSLLERRATGSLVLETTDHQRGALSIERGTVVKARLPAQGTRLSELLVEWGWLTPDVAEHTYADAARRQQLHGLVLVEQGLLSRDTVDRALRSQLLRKLDWTSELAPETIFGFYDKVDFLASQAGAPVPVAPLVVLYHLTKHAPDGLIEPVASRLETLVLRLHPQAQPERFGLDEAERAVVDVLRARPQRPAELRELELIRPNVLARLLYVLIITRHLESQAGPPLGLGFSRSIDEDFLEPKPAAKGAAHPVALGSRGTGAEPAPGAGITPARAPSPSVTNEQGRDGVHHAAPARPLPSEHSATPKAMVPPVATVDAPTTALSAPIDGQAVPKSPTLPKAAEAASAGTPVDPVKPNPPATSPDMERRAAELKALATKIEGLDHYGVLGVTKDAPPASIQVAYFQLAKLYHPDRLPSDLKEIRNLATTVFARMTEAYQVLSTPERRREYDETKSATSVNEEESVRRVLRAFEAFQKAEILVKKRMWPAAELEVNRALEDDPGQPDYLALAAWIVACRTEGAERLPDVLRMLNQAVEQNPKSEKNRFYRVQVLRRLGKLDEAIVDCRYIVEQNPYHTDAQREIRLYEMRRAAVVPPTTAAKPPAGGHSRSHPAPRQSQQAGPRPPEASPGILGKLFKR